VGGKATDQVAQLIKAGLVSPELRLTRCSLCNSRLIPIPAHDPSGIRKGIPDVKPDNDTIFWCTRCQKAYWEGSHTSNMRITLADIAKETQ
jgi:uncharacterized protein with PIN domain